MVASSSNCILVVLTHCPTQTIHDWVLLLIVAIVVGVDVFIHLVGTAPPQIRIEANLTRDIQHPSNINVRLP